MGDGARPLIVGGRSSYVDAHTSMHRHAQKIVYPLTSMMPSHILNDPRTKDPAPIERSPLKHHLIETSQIRRRGESACSRDTCSSRRRCVEVSQSGQPCVDIVDVRASLLLRRVDADKEVIQSQGVEQRFPKEHPVILVGKGLNQHC